MDQNRGILFLAGPLHGGSAVQMKREYTNSTTLIFDENGRYLSLAQTALWRMRQAHNWICVAAEGEAAAIAVALAAQLPVDRLALAGSGLFSPRQKGQDRELARLSAYARRNLSLVISEIMLIGAAERELRGFLRGRARGRICAVEERETGWESCLDLLASPWEQACQNNLLIPSKCV